MKARLLVVDDDPMMLELLVTRLELAGYAVATARDGLEALRRLHEYRPHGVILDINMPRLDGFGVLEQMNTGRWPVLVLTARNQTPDVQRAISLGARDFLSKPFKDNQLLLRVARLLRKTGAETEALVI
jgi:two-component system OmpR family response regulator